MEEIKNNMKALLLVITVYLVAYTINLWKNKKL
jgi:hypothetical protein